MPYCTNCGGERAEGARYCTNCGVASAGAPLPPPPPPRPSHPTPVAQQQRGDRKHGCLKWGGIGCGSLLAVGLFIGVIIALAVSSDGGSSAQSTPPAPTPTFQEAVAQAREISYDDLFRNNDSYIGSIVHYRGKIIQVVEGSGDNYNLRVDVTQGEYFWEDTVYLHYSGERLLEDDIIEFVGEVKGLKKYSAIFGNTVTIPELEVIQSRLISKG